MNWNESSSKNFEVTLTKKVFETDCHEKLTDTKMSFDRNWFHGFQTRERAEEILRENGFGEGLFLVRESSSAAGDFVLSVVHDNEVIHYQIRRRGEDALFSLSEEKKVSSIGGLVLSEALSFYVQKH